MPIIDRIEKLDLPIGHYVVIGGVMEIHGIRSARDVDIVVDEYLFTELQRRGWRRKWLFWRVLSCKLLTDGNGAEAFSNYQCGNYHPATEELIQRAEFIGGVPFLPLHDLILFKKQLARKKDLDDVALIEQHLTTHL